MIDSVYFLIAISFGIGLIAFLLFLWGNKKKQFHDIEEPKYRILTDDEEDDKNNKNFP